MKINKKTIIICITIILLYIIGVMFFGFKSNTVKNTKLHVELTERPRLEDDFYDYVNYDKLSQVLIDENKLNDSWTYYSYYEKEIEKEKKNIIDNIIKNCDSYSEDSIHKKMCNYYYSLKNTNYEENKKILNEYVNMINSSSNIEEFQKNIAIVNRKFYDANILFSLDFGLKDDNFDDVYPEISHMYYDYTNNNAFYNAAFTSTYGKYRSYLKNSDIKILMEYGYSEVESKNIVSNIYSMFAAIAKYSLISSSDDEETKLYSLSELKNKYNNINFDLIQDELVYRYNSSSNIIVADESQLKLINEYLVNDNLETLKKYALVRLLYSYGDLINENILGIINNLENKLNGTIIDDSDDNYYETAIYEKINDVFSDTIAIEFAKIHSYDKLKPYYTDLINQYLKEYTDRINNESWLGEETKKNAIKKIDKMGVNVLYPDVDKATYINIEGNNIFEIDNSISRSYCNYIFYHMKDYYVLTNDWLEVNAFYSPVVNSIFLEIGYVYAFNQVFNIDSNNIDNYVYETIGGIGYTIGHELSHAFDNTGSKYDENGKENNWWTDEDKIAYNKLNLKVEKYYDKLNQDGYQTLGENIADLGGFALTVQLAEHKQASNDDFKKMFESAAKFDAMQSTNFINGWLLLNDEHSLNKNRINGVFSSLDKFYEVYNIKETDKMYVSPSDRVSVW